ncbi:hypothetical protein PR202_gb16530 [Eleusine coracana subsp. coracana]|uniref:Non-structural maintenance of chromosomes element 1 homolog n=1 Tax=Eleusine coracana subsp. coracana TaxID=191504 RepID=A0AAV5F048_ELECO|nr:hypothetical protein PR202_gb16530 [Eleusine coracana subsp. coracana]
MAMENGFLCSTLLCCCSVPFRSVSVAAPPHTAAGAALPEPDFHAVFAAISGKNPATSACPFFSPRCQSRLFVAFLSHPNLVAHHVFDEMLLWQLVTVVAIPIPETGMRHSSRFLRFLLQTSNLDAIIHEAGNDGSITNIDALNVRLENQVVIADADGSQDSQSRLPTSIKNFTLTQKEKTLTELIRDRWLSCTSSGNIGLGIRSFLDLRSWFRGNDIPSCVVCNKPCIKASTCPNEGCNVRIHDYCLKKKFSQRKAPRACPGCGAEWPWQEGEVDDNDDVNEPGEDEVPSANRSSRKRRKGVELNWWKKMKTLAHQLKLCPGEV